MIVNKNRRWLATLGLMIFSWVANISAQGQFAIPNCPDATESQFKYVPLIGRQGRALVADNSLAEPIHMAFDMLADGKVDVYFAERYGLVKKYSPTTNTVTTIGEITVTTNSEMGLTGIALDPGFKTNSWIYLFYAINNELRLSRYTLTAGNLPVTTEKRVLTYRKVSSAHMGGALAFDSNGDLWISTGNDASDYPAEYNENTESGSSEASSANLNDFRGGILRIHPDNSTKGYSVPAGNFGEYWSNQFKANGNTSLAADYADPTKVKPELYVKGARNAYSIAVDTVKHWVAFGSIGINVTTSNSEAHYLLNHPAFVGYPYFAGGFGKEPGSGYYDLWSGQGASKFNTAHPGLIESISGPVNNSKWNTGPKQLPPVTPGTHSYLRGTVGAAAVSGSFYHYNPASTSKIKFPPHFEGVWTITDWVQNDNLKNAAGGGFQGVKIFKVKPDGSGLADSLKWFKNFGITGPLDMQFGPDGALYILNYGPAYFGTTAETNIARIEYTGSYCPTSVSSPKHSETFSILHTGTRFTVNLEGDYSIRIQDLTGREISFSKALTGKRDYRLEDLVPTTTPRGIFAITVSGHQATESFRLYKD